MKKVQFTVILLLFSKIIFAQAWQDTSKIIDRFYDKYTSDRPGCQLSISKDGRLIYSKAWGLAEIEHHTPYTTETITEAGSISKQFTAAAILLLEQQGKLSLNSPVRKYLPELPVLYSSVTVKNLLYHTSGLRDWSSLVAFTGWPRGTKVYRNEDVLQLICLQEKLNNFPGEEYLYSNSNYILLAIIAERVSGMSLDNYTKKYIFEPAGMTHTRWRDDFGKVVMNRGIAYGKKNGLDVINMPNDNVYGSGGLLTTTEDLIKWNDFYLHGKIGGIALLNKQLRVEKLP